ncbi:NPHS1 [Cordylochernes scorpioides]|uniref:NPHS1 n=1 Tax=Cordylochernes scorpioides TaxID=51811 RepID=A0ABY6LSG6_9ARAC|nr:NPHS1 [Cordylochernes scorpioides]
MEIFCRSDRMCKREVKHPYATGPPDPPAAVQIGNITWDSVTISWVPGYSSGLHQTFLLRVTLDSGPPRLLEAHGSPYKVGGLSPSSEIGIAVAGRSALGAGPFSEPDVVVTTAPGIPPDLLAIYLKIINEFSCSILICNNIFDRYLRLPINSIRFRSLTKTFRARIGLVILPDKNCLGNI